MPEKMILCVSGATCSQLALGCETDRASKLWRCYLVHSSHYEGVLTVFLNELALQQGQSILVLKDYHTISSPHVHETLAFLLDYAPETLRVVLITRRDPPLPLARLQHLRGETAQALQALTALAAQNQIWPHLLREIHVCHARLALASGDLVLARQQVSLSAQCTSSTHFPHQQELALLNARLLISQGEHDETLALLSIWQSEASAASCALCWRSSSYKLRLIMGAKKPRRRASPCFRRSLWRVQRAIGASFSTKTRLWASNCAPSCPRSATSN